MGLDFPDHICSTISGGQMDHPETLRHKVARAFRYYPYKGVERFYDLGGILNDVEATRDMLAGMAVLVESFPKATKLGLLDARGFLFAPLATMLGMPIVMIRKIGKMPNTVTSGDYETEYGKREGVSIQRHAVKRGDRIVLIDDLVATGGTLGAAIACVEAAGAKVEGCLSLVELDAFAEKRKEVIPAHVPRVALFETEAELLAMGASPGALPEGYADDGAQFESGDTLPKV